MIQELGGPSAPALGFAAGIERLILESGAEAAAPSIDTFVAPLGKAAVEYALVLGRDLRKAGISCEVDARGSSLKAQLRRANALGARFALIVGDDEVSSSSVQVKDLGAQAQERVERASVVAAITTRLRTS
jgi:histidyl-tRNA synthetase